MGDGAATGLRIDFAHKHGPLSILLGTDSGKVSGLVKDAEGKPAAEARVTLIPEKGSNTRVEPNGNKLVEVTVR